MNSRLSCQIINSSFSGSKTSALAALDRCTHHGTDCQRDLRSAWTTALESQRNSPRRPVSPRGTFTSGTASGAKCLEGRGPGRKPLRRRPRILKLDAVGDPRTRLEVLSRLVLQHLFHRRFEARE